MASPRTLLLIAFISGMGVTGIEISGARLLAPFFGTSLFVWTNVIGVVLTALSLGYYIGGRLSERRPDLHLLLKIIFAAGWLCIITPWTIRPLVLAAIPDSLANLSGSASVLILGSLLSGIALFGIPIMLLGMTSPFLIRLRTLHASDTGIASGDIFAWSTLGSIVGTFAPTLVMIPILGTRMTVVLFSAMLIGLGSLGLASFGRRLLAAILVLPLLAASSSLLRPAPNLLAERDSVHQFLQVLVDPDGTRYIAANEGLGRQSLYHPDRIATGAYFDAFTLLPLLTEMADTTDTLIVGLAGGTIARQLHTEFGSHVRLEAVEIDQAMTELGKKYFGMTDVPVDIHHTDGRTFLQFTDKYYDLIIIDAYQNELYIPWTLTTGEFWRATKQRLAPGGAIAINVNAPSASSPLLRAIENTVAGVFPATYLAPVGSGSFNYIIVASDRTIDPGRLATSSNPGLAAMGTHLAANLRRTEFDPNSLVLTDDRAPVDFLTETSLIQHLRNQ